MGARNSRLPSPRREGEGEGGQPSDSSSASRPTPFIEAPYAGPWAEYQFVDVTSPVLADVAFASDVTSASEVTMASTRTSGVLEALEGLYSQGYSLVTLCRVPGGAGGAAGGGVGVNYQRQVFVPGREVRYQGIFCRYEGDPGNEGWNLRAEKSLLLAHHVTPGVVSSEAGPGSQHVERLISRTAQTGGRLLTVQWSGQPLTSSVESVMGVDVFFEVPDQALPERSVYQLVTAPATLVKRSLFASKGHVTCDWSGILTRHLARGWRLVDIFCESSSASVSASLSPANAKIQTVWFFEKPESRARDDSAVYEGSIVEHWVDVSSSLSSSSPISSSPASCLGSGRVDCKKGGGIVSKRSFTKRMASLRKKSDDGSRAEGDVKQSGDVREGTDEQKTKPSPQSENIPAASGETALPALEGNHVDHSPSQAVPSQTPNTLQGAGWEGVIRSMGEKGWELASVINTMDTQVMAGRSKVKVLLVFQRKISLAMAVKGRRTSDGLALRADTGASTSAMCDIPMMIGETASHLNPSLAVRLPLSRSASRDQDDFQASCDDDIPSTIGGSCSRTVSAADLSSLGRGLDSGSYLEPSGRDSAKGREEGGLLLQPSSSVGDEGSVGTAGRSSTSSQHSRVTAAEVHVTTCAEETTSFDRKAVNSEEDLTNQRADSENASNQSEGDKDSGDEPTNQAQADIGNSEECSLQTEDFKDASEEKLSNQNIAETDGSGSLSNQYPSTAKELSSTSKETSPEVTESESLALGEQMKDTLPKMTFQSVESPRQDSQKTEEQTHTASQDHATVPVCPESIELTEHTLQQSAQSGGREETELDNGQTENLQDCASEGKKTTDVVDAAATNLPRDGAKNETEISIM